MKSHRNFYSLLISLLFLGLFQAGACAEPFFHSFDIFASGSEMLELNLDSAINMAMARNIALQVERINPKISQTYVEGEKAKFDTRVEAEFSGTERISKVIFQQGDLGQNVTNRSDAGITLSRINHAGTRTAFELSTTRTRSARSDNLFSTRIGVSLEHPLKRGAGKEVNLVSLRKSELDLSWSEYELRGFVLNLVAEIESKYWNYYLSTRQLEIMTESFQLAEQQREETYRRIEAGSIPESEAAAAEAEVMLRKEELINAESAATLAAVSFLRIINPDTEDFWRKKPVIADELFSIQTDTESLEKLLQIALAERPEIEQADLMIQRDRLEVVSTKNGLLPKLDFFVNMGKTGYATSFSGTNPKPGEEGSYDLSAGFVYELTRGRRDAKAEHQRARLSVKMRQEAMKNLEQLIKLEVIDAYIEVKRTLEQIKATASTAEKQLEKLRVEEVKFSVGKTTSFQVAQAQRDLTAAKIAQVKAAIHHQQAFTELLRASGTLLYQRNIILAKSSE
jgi:outer membrane protein TolC